MHNKVLPKISELSELRFLCLAGIYFKDWRKLVALAIEGIITTSAHVTYKLEGTGGHVFSSIQ